MKIQKWLSDDSKTDEDVVMGTLNETGNSCHMLESNMLISARAPSWLHLKPRKFTANIGHILQQWDMLKSVTVKKKKYKQLKWLWKGDDL